MMRRGIFNQLEEIAKDAERKFGLPPLSKLVETVDKLPGEKRLRLIKDVLVAADRASQSAPELDKVISLINEVNSLPIDKLIKLEKVLKRIEKIMKAAPQDLLEFLSSLKEE